MTRITVTLLILAVDVTLIFWAIRPGWSDVATRRAEIRELTELHAEFTAIQTRRDELVGRYNTIPADDLAKLAAILPPRREIFQPLTDYEILSRRHGLNLTEIDFPSGAPESAAALALPAPGGRRAVEPINFTMGLTGPYPGIRAFLSDLERYIRLSDVTDMQLGSGGGAANEHRLQLKGKFYSRK